MEVPRTAGLTGVLVVLLSFAASLAQAVPLVPAGHLNLLAVDCKVGDVAGRCIIDTGAQGVVILPVAVAGFAKLPVLASRHAMGAAGVAQTSDQVKVGAIEVGDFELKQPAEAYRQGLPDPYPVLGSGFVQSMQTVTFDLHAMTLTRDAPAGRICPDRSRVTTMIEVPADFAGQPIQAGWDTGSGITMVDASLVARHPELFQFEKDLPAEDSTGTTAPSKIYRTNAVTLCGVKINGLPVGAIDLSEARKKKPDLPEIIFGDNLLGGHVWSFDFRDGRWSLN